MDPAPEGAAPEKGFDEKQLDSKSLQDVEADIMPTSAVHTDVALGLYKESLTFDPDRRELVAAKVRRKLDMILLPTASPSNTFESCRVC